MSICVIVPSRGRPHAAVELSRQFYTTTHRDDTYLVFGLDDDDPELERYRGLLAAEHNVSFTVGPRLRMGPTLNHLAVIYATRHNIIGFMGDDHRPRTAGWDEHIADVLDLAPGVAYGDDGIHGPRLPTSVFITSDIITRLGYMAPPGLVHLYLDNFWLELGRATSLTYLPHVSIEHMHPIAGKAQWDDGYRECNSDAITERDAAEFQRYLRVDWPAARAKL